jgi:hypothetical protein
MALSDTVLARFKKLLRVELNIKPQDIVKVTPTTGLGAAPLTFDDHFIDTDLRHRINNWFEDLIDPQKPGSWDAESTVGAVVGDVVDASEVPDLAGYRLHVERRSAIALDRAIGTSTPNVPVADRPRVQATLNISLLTLLIRDVSLDDLAGSRQDVIDNLVGRMVV